MSLLAKDNMVLYIEAQLSWLHILRRPLKGIRRVIKWLKGARKVNSVYVYTPPPLFPFGNFSLLLNRINQGIISIALSKQIKKFSFKKPILWIYTPNSYPLIDKTDEKLSVYYCLDDFPSEIAINKRKRAMKLFEDTILRKADVVFACTKILSEERKDRRPDIHFIRNGVDSEIFKNTDAKKVAQDDIENINHPRIGFIGTLDSRIDAGLLSFLASKRKDWNIVLIGDNVLSFSDRMILERRKNIHFLGFKKHSQLSGYISSMDVCIIPYRTDGFNKAIFPIKTFEYMACGKPVISTYLPELEEFKHIIKLSRDRVEFLDNIEFFLNNVFDTSLYRQIVQNNSWNNKVGQISGVILEVLNKKEAGF